MAKKKSIKKKLMFVASECAPYCRTGGLGDVIGSLPKALAELGNEVTVVIPLYSSISNDYKYTMRFLGSLYVPLSWRNQYCGVFEQYSDGVRYVFLDNEYYFRREGLYGHYDDAEKFAFFSKAALECLPILGSYPDVIHCNDWHTAMVPVFLDVMYRDIPEYSNIKTVFTIHNIEFQGKYSESILDDVLGIPADKESLLEYGGCINFLKGAIECSNLVTTVSETYAREIFDDYYAFGLKDILTARAFKIRGVLNGIDEKVYDPATDESLFVNYSKRNIAKRQLNKEGLCAMLNLPYDPNKPLLAIVSRLTNQKGIDLLAGAMDRLLQAEVQLVVLGTGDWKYESMFKTFETIYGNKLRVICSFSSDLASKIYAGSDIFLMPSKFEPCGLAQMIAMRYGSVPIVRETGGLKDTVPSYDPATGEGKGFSFAAYDCDALLECIGKATDIFCNSKDEWKKIQLNGMSSDFSWLNSARKYDALYAELLK